MNQQVLLRETTKLPQCQQDAVSRPLARRRPAVLVALTLASCVGAPGEQGNEGLQSLVVTSREPAGENCAEGGIAITAGVDEDNDGELDDGEAGEPQYVCNGERGPAGADGADGTDGADGQDGENGTDGSDGADGADGANGADGADGEGLAELDASSADGGAGGEGAPNGDREGGAGGSALSLDRDATNGEAEAAGASGGIEASSEANRAGESGAATSHESPAGDLQTAQAANVVTVLRVIEEPRGASCLYGGQRIEVGIDRNGNRQRFARPSPGR